MRQVADSDGIAGNIDAPNSESNDNGVERVDEVLQSPNSVYDVQHGKLVANDLGGGEMLNAQRIQHVSLAVPAERVTETIEFYRDVLGFPSGSVPETLRIQRNVIIWFQVGTDEIHLLEETDPQNSYSRRHLCIQVDDLEGARAVLERAGYEPEEAIPIPGRPRFFCNDPAGNLVEFMVLEQPE